MTWFTDLLKDYPSLSVAHERLQLAQERMDKLKAENDLLKSKLKRCSKAYRKAKEAAERYQQTDDLVSRGGISWKREGDSFEGAPYCNCGEVMYRFPPMGRPMYWMCSACKRKVDFSRPPKDA